MYRRLPKHIGVIPDGNRRWAVLNSLNKEDGYKNGIYPGVQLCKKLISLGINEVTFYGFTKDNNKRPKEQVSAYISACVDAINSLKELDCSIFVVGNTEKDIFPKELVKYTKNRIKYGKGILNINFLINYDWNWDLGLIKNFNESSNKIIKGIASKDISRIDLIIRWGNRFRLSGFLPVQSVYSDFYIIKDFWPDYKNEHLIEALDWYQTCDVTLGG